MVPLDTVAAQQETLSPVNQRLRGERLTVQSADEKWPLRRTVLFVLLTSLVLWSGIYFAVTSLL